MAVLTRWSPSRALTMVEPAFRPLDIFEDLDTWVERLWETPTRFDTGYTWPMDIWEDKDNLVIKCELPGIGKEDIDISLEGDMLTIKAEKKQEELPEDTKYYSRERCFGCYSRTISLPYPVDAGKVSAHYENGVLEIKFPKSEESKTKHIDISVK